MTSRFLIYGLIDPRDGQLRYVGKSCEGVRRPKRHCELRRLRKDGGTHKANWLRQLLAAGLKPDIEVLETCGSPEALVEAEQFHIAYFRMVGCDLTNMTVGGDGTPGLSPSTETRQKIAASLMGNVPYNKGAKGLYKPTVETLQKMSLAHKGIKRGPMVGEQKVRISRSRGGKPLQDGEGVVYSSVQEAARQTGLWPTSIIRSLKYGYRAKGRRFSYVEVS